MKGGLSVGVELVVFTIDSFIIGLVIIEIFVIVIDVDAFSIVSFTIGRHLSVVIVSFSIIIIISFIIDMSVFKWSIFSKEVLFLLLEYISVRIGC